MRGHEKYIEKVHDELDIYRKHLLTGEAIPSRFNEAFEKMAIARAWLKSGYSDTDVLQMLKNDPQTRLQARRAREILVLAYELFADIRLARNADGIKQKYADELNEQAFAIKADIDFLRTQKSETKDIADLLKVWAKIKSEAAKIDGAYLPTVKGSGNLNKPTRIIFKRKTVIKNNQVQQDTVVEEAEYELES